MVRPIPSPPRAKKSHKPHPLSSTVLPLADAPLISAGIQISTLDALAHRTGLTKTAIKQIAAISEGTLARRKLQGRFSPEESDRLYRLHRVTSRVLDFFDHNKDAAHRWLHTPIRALSYHKPLDLLGTDAGAAAVTALITRLEHGVFS